MGDMGVPLKTLEDSHQQHYEASQKGAAGQRTHLASLGTLPVVQQEVERNITTTSSLEARSLRSRSMWRSSLPSYITAWVARKSTQKVKSWERLVQSLACTQQGKWQVACMATIVLVGILF